MGDIIFGDKYEFRDHSRKVEINLSVLMEEMRKAQQQAQEQDAEEEEAYGYAEYEEAAPDGDSYEEETEEEELNYFQPELHLTRLLTGDWFAELRTDERYDKEWCRKFVTSLMASEHRDAIAKDWAVTGRSKKDLIRGCIVGCLKDEGVVKGSYDGIARAIWGKEENFRSYGIYLGKGKKQAYASWIKKYVKEAVNSWGQGAYQLEEQQNRYEYDNNDLYLSDRDGDSNYWRRL